MFDSISDRNDQQVSEQQRNRLAAWEMEYGHPLELDADLVKAYETVYEDERKGRDGGTSR